MTDIPDDVVERACEAYAKARYDGQYKWPNDFLSEDQDKVRGDMRAAGRVFVEWEREQIVAVAKTKAHHLKTMRTIGGAVEQRQNAEIALLFEKFADNIRARGE